jgi:Zn-dependent protease/predicted transcriptional regulator
LRLHVTFLLLLGVIGYETFAEAGLRGSFWALTLVCAIFACIALHELGHSVVAQQLGVQVKSITLLPIGGVAALRNIPENPWHEIAITLAGPMVNAAIAVVLLPFTGLPSRLFLVMMPHDLAGLVHALATVNLGLFLFNLLPAFPMDGGRLLRAVLALAISYRRATAIAATVGQGLAVLSVLAGFRLWPSPNALWLIIIGTFIFVAAEGEEKMVRMRTVLREIDVDDVMSRQFAALAPLDTVARGLERVYQTGQDAFPVLDGERVVGLATRQAMAEAMNTGGGDVPIAEVMDTDVPVVSPRASVSQVYERMLGEGHASFPVMQDGRLVGLLGTENISRYLLVQSSIRSSRRRRRAQRTGAGRTPTPPPVIATVPPVAVPPPPEEPAPPAGRA